MTLNEARNLLSDLPDIPHNKELKSPNVLYALRIASEWIESHHNDQRSPLLTDWHRAAIIVALADYRQE